LPVAERTGRRTHLCRIEARPLAEADAWLENYRRMWEENFQRLDELLEEMKAEESHRGTTKR
jgi:hypothetical protein